LKKKGVHLQNRVCSKRVNICRKGVNICRKGVNICRKGVNICRRPPPRRDPLPGWRVFLKC